MKRASGAPRTRHSARAAARLELPDEARESLGEDSDLLAEARFAGVLAARQASAILARSPEVEFDVIEVSFERSEDTVVVESVVTGFSRRRLDTFAMSAVLGAAMSIVDAFSEHGRAISIADARVIESTGGSLLSYVFDPPVRAAVLSISNAVESGHKDDRAGGVVRSAVGELEVHGVELEEYRVVGDDDVKIEEMVRAFRDDGLELVLTVGGTGLAHTDSTVEALEPLLETEIPGLMEALRDYGLEQTPIAFVSRGIAGLAGETLVVTLPGSTSGAREAVEAVFPALLHVIRVRRRSRAYLVDA